MKPKSAIPFFSMSINQSWRYLRSCILFLFIAFCIQNLSAQTHYNIDDVNGQILYTFEGESILIYDSGGEFGVYQNFEDYSVTICTGNQLAGCPPIPGLNALVFSFDVEAEPNCTYDYLEVQGFDRYCNSNLPPLFQPFAPSGFESPGGCMTLIFHSDLSEVKEGFAIEFFPDFIYSNPDPLTCGSQLLDGSISIPIEGCMTCTGYYECGGDTYGPYPGAEEKYNIEASGITTLTIEGDVDFFVYGMWTLIGPNFCPPIASIACAVGNQSSVTFNADDYPFGIWVIIDSEVWGDYLISLTCGSGDLNCDNADPIECGDVINSSNSSASGGQNNVNDYCNSQLNDWTGNERVYLYEAEFSGQLEISLSNLDADLDLFVLNECDASNCVDKSSESGIQDELISIPVEDGEFYLIVIDGYDGAQSNFTLSLSCQSEECTDCGECFTYTLWNKGTLTDVICKPKFVDCNVTDYPTADHTFSWTVGGIPKSSLHKPILQVETGKTTKVCQNVKYKGNPIYQCCWDIHPQTGCSKPPVAYVELGGGWPLLDATFDASQSTDGAKYYWNFGDGTPLLNSGTDPTVEHTYEAGGYKYCTYVENNYGISVYCKSFGPGAIECTADDNPKFTYTLSGRTITVKDIDGMAAHVSSYNIDFGDNTPVVNGNNWTNRTHNFTKDSIYEICIRYVTSLNVGSLPCNQSGCICFTVRINCCEQTIDQCYDIRPVFIADQGGLVYNLVYEATDVLVTKWEIEGVSIPNSDANSLTYTFPSAGYYNVCCYYRNPVTNCNIRCCKRIYIANPFSCGNINYSYVSSENGYRFDLNLPSNDVEEIIWTVDEPVSLEIGTNLQSDVVSIPSGSCKTYIISVRYYDKPSTSYQLCCFRLYLCNPLECSATIKSQLLGNGQTRFSTDEQYQEMKWLANGQLIGTGGSVDYQLPSGGALISLQYYDQAANVYKECCRQVLTATDHLENLEQIQIAPNPATDYLNLYLSFNIPTCVGVELTNEVGVIVRHIPMGAVGSAKFSQRVEMADLARGMYFLRVWTEKGEMVRRVVCL